VVMSYAVLSAGRLSTSRLVDSVNWLCRPTWHSVLQFDWTEQIVNTTWLLTHLHTWRHRLTDWWLDRVRVQGMMNGCIVVVTDVVAGYSSSQSSDADDTDYCLLWVQLHVALWDEWIITADWHLCHWLRSHQFLLLLLMFNVLSWLLVLLALGVISLQCWHCFVWLIEVKLDVYKLSSEAVDKCKWATDQYCDSEAVLGRAGAGQRSRCCCALSSCCCDVWCHYWQH